MDRMNVTSECSGQTSDYVDRYTGVLSSTATTTRVKKERKEERKENNF